ncbi:hypothetical protein Ae201684P_010872 [Aphanomyces euteiches]|nr:hypothetical protein Ae201684P_010872 [Aphanomyces euteiches]
MCLLAWATRPSSGKLGMTIASLFNSHGRHNDSFLNLLPCAHFKSMDLIQLSSTHPVATAAAALVMAGASTMFYYFVIEPATSPLNALPGPP